jgi:hypothetical protein
LTSIPQRIKAVIDKYAPPGDREYYYNLAKKESSFNPNLTSSTGAAGLFQFTKGTGRKYGLLDYQGDRRANVEANVAAAVRLTEDNRNALRRNLGREPTHGELALAHQQGAGTAALMRTGAGNAPPQNLRVNAIDPNLPGPKAAEKIMQYYGYGPNGLSLATNQFTAAPVATRDQLFNPASTTTTAPPLVAPNSNPPIASASNTGVTLNTAPAQPPPQSGFQLPISDDLKKKMLGTDAKGTDSILGDLGVIAKGIKNTPPAPEPVLPSTGASVDQRLIQQQQLAQQLMSQLMMAKRPQRLM